MSSSTRTTALDRPRAVSAVCDDDNLHVTIEDGRVISVPLDWFDWLASASLAQRNDIRITEGGAGIVWNQLDDSLSVPGLLGLPEYP
jgi:hypothetical protein